MKAPEAQDPIDLAHEASFRMGDLDVAPSTREVVFAGRREVVEPRIMQVLVALARRRGLVVSRNDLIESCWGGRIVGDDAINRAIAGVRRIGAASGAFAVDTVTRVGYRLAEVDPRPGAPIRPAAVTEGPAGAAAIMATAVVGYARLTENDEAGGLAMVRAVHDQLARLVGDHGGRVVSLSGAGAVVVFADASEAVDCALAFQHEIADLGVGVAADRAILCRVGLHYGEAAEAHGVLTGEAVDIAVGVEAFGEPSAIVVSEALRVAARRRPAMTDMGFHQLTGVATPVRLWRVVAPEDADSAAEPRGPRPDAMGGGRPAIAVLAFEHPPDDREQTYLAEGVAEDVIAALSRFKWLFVLSRHASLAYRKPDAGMAQMRAELGVGYVVSGRLMCRESHLRLTVNLTDLVKGDTLWSRRFDAPLADIFTIQDEITATIVGALEPALIGREEQGAASPAPRSLKHWDLFIRGRWHFWQLTFGHMAKARQILLQALALKPDDAPTLSLLAYTHCTRLWSGWAEDIEGEIAEARRLAMRAVRADRDDAMAHYAYGTTLSLTGDLAGGMVEQRRALELNPNYAAAMGEMGRYLAYLGRHDEAMSFLDRAIRSSPGDAQRFLWFRDKAIAAFIVGRYDVAVAFAHESVALRPDIFLGPYLLAACWAADGYPDKGSRSLAEGRLIMPRYPLRTLLLGHPFARLEDQDRFIDALRQCGWDD